MTISPWSADLNANQRSFHTTVTRYAGAKPCNHSNIIIWSLYVIAERVRVWKPMQINKSRGNVIKPSYTKDQASSRIQTQTGAAAWLTKASMQEHYYRNSTDCELTHAPSATNRRLGLDRQGFSQTTNLTKMNITVPTDMQNMLWHCHVVVENYAKINCYSDIENAQHRVNIFFNCYFLHFQINKWSNK